MYESFVKPNNLTPLNPVTLSAFQTRLVTPDQSNGEDAVSIKSSYADYRCGIEQKGNRSSRGCKSKLDIYLISKLGIF